MVSWGCRIGHSNLWYPGVTEEGVVGPIEQRRMGTCLVWEFGRSCIGSTIYTLPSNPRIPQSCSMYMCNIIIVKLTLVLCYACTHPHTHTPTHLHTHTPSHPHTLTPTHPQWYYRVWSICSSKASLSSGPWNNPLWQNQPGEGRGTDHLLVCLT